MKNAILFDKFKNRKELEIETATENLVVQEELNNTLYEVEFVLKFYDNKQRAVYIEKNRTVNTEK